MLELDIKKTLSGADGPFVLQVRGVVRAGELTALTGASGAGKTTLLRMISGLDNPDEGRIAWSGVEWFNSGAGINLRPQQRNVGLVFQDYALFPTMTVRRNLEFAAGDRNAAAVDFMLGLIELRELQHRFPGALSGGQQQRVALARALIRKPGLLLMDEPLSSLDPAMRGRLQDEILRLKEQLDLTIILVSHQTREIARMASTVLMIEDGRACLLSPGEYGAVHLDSSGRRTGRIVGFKTGGSLDCCILLVEAGGDLLELTLEYEEWKNAVGRLPARS
ncbi:MAG: ATP-binding cassette domain-containing protein [Pseudomonadota bacterium]